MASLAGVTSSARNIASAVADKTSKASKAFEAALESAKSGETATTTTSPSPSGGTTTQGGSSGTTTSTPTTTPGGTPTPGTTTPTPSTPNPSSGGSTSRSAPTEVTVTTIDGNTVLDAGADKDQINVTQRNDGGLDITTNGETYNLTEKESQNVTIRGGAGADTVEVDTNVTVDLTIEGGSGNDIIVSGDGNDTISGGAGNDYIDGGGGNDILEGGIGRDTIYGLGGNDIIRGGDGNDYLDGGRGNDKIYGQEGDDAVSGGRGDDFLTGNAGNDSLIAGAGNDRISDTVTSNDNDKVFAEASDDVNVDSNATIEHVDMSRTNAAGDPLGSSITIEGTDRFRARVESDLETLRSMPDGQQLLANLDDSGHQTTIRETDGGNSASRDQSLMDRVLGRDETDGNVNYNPEAIRVVGPGARPPIVGLVHELLHAEDYVNGTLASGQTNGVNNRELSATGLPWDQDGDGTADPNTRPITDNSFREDLNIAPRSSY